jgi:glycosyltransferase involved in cell wall biosynthesis
MHKVAVFGYKVTPADPTGGCHLRMLKALCHQYEFTVFAVEFRNPCPERICWVRIPAPSRPQVLLFIVYHLLAPVAYGFYCIFRRKRFDLIQSVELAAARADVTHSHFCNRYYLNERWRESSPRGIRRLLRWLDHRLRALFEPMAFRTARAVVVPSQGLLRELSREYPEVAGKTYVIANSIDLAHWHRPEGFDREQFRNGLGVGPGDFLLSFVALGHFERKGLPLTIGALERLDDRGVKLVVVGGPKDLIAGYGRLVERKGLAGRVRFARMQRDVRPYLWASDAFVFPSSYETFSLATFEAAASGLPVVVTRLHGVEEFLRDGENGILVERTSEAVAEGIARVLALTPHERRALGEQARRDIQRYSVENYVAAWREFYRGLNVA